MAKKHELTLAFLDAHPVDAARVLEGLPAEAAAAFLSDLPVRLSAPVLARMLPSSAALCIGLLDEEQAAGIIKAVGPYGGSVILRLFPEGRRRSLLSRLPTSLSVIYALLLGYPADTVGAWMDPSAPAFPPDLSAGQALEQVRRRSGDHDSLFVVGRDQRLLGLITLHELLRADAAAPLSRMLRPFPGALPARASIASVRSHAGWYERHTLPVVELNDRFVGSLHFGDLSRAVLRAPVADPPAVEGVLAPVAQLTWSVFSGFIQALIGLLPAEAALRRKEGRDA